MNEAWLSITCCPQKESLSLRELDMGSQPQAPTKRCPYLRGSFVCHIPQRYLCGDQPLLIVITSLNIVTAEDKGCGRVRGGLRMKLRAAPRTVASNSGSSGTQTSGLNHVHDVYRRVINNNEGALGLALYRFLHTSTPPTAPRIPLPSNSEKRSSSSRYQT